jgi:hypothetical protein
VTANLHRVFNAQQGASRHCPTPSNQHSQPG